MRYIFGISLLGFSSLACSGSNATTSGTQSSQAGATLGTGGTGGQSTFGTGGATGGRSRRCPAKRAGGTSNAGGVQTSTVATGGALAKGGSSATGGHATGGTAQSIGGMTAGGTSSGVGGAATGGHATTGGTTQGTGGKTTGGTSSGVGGAVTGGASAGGKTGTGGSTGTAGASCTPSCANKTCGSDGCDGTCGGCLPSQMCGTNGTCQTKSGTGIVVDANSQLTPISPDIYGVAFAADTNDDSYKVATLDRWGGDAETSYNWQKDMHNSGGDWYCANYVGGGHDADTFVQTNNSRGLNTLMTIPITGWLANVETSSDNTYSSAIGHNLSYCNSPSTSTPTGSDCCKAIGTQESILVNKGSNNLDTSFMGNWVSHFVSTFGTAANGGIKYYQLDNEPDNWQGLRQDIYPTLYPPGTNCMDYSVKITSGNESGVSPNDDIMNRSVAYAAAIKNADPSAQVLFLSVMNPDDMIDLMQTECGVGSWGSEAVPYTIDNSYAMAMMAKGKQYETDHHQRIFDCLDTHYPGSAQEMWTNTVSHFRSWINSTYPGTGICVSEYNVSNDTSDQAATTKQADYLGTFGVMGVRVASYWTTLVPNNVHNYAYNAFAMFQNYDGAGGKFGNVSVGAASSYSGVHAYAATDAATNPTKLWVMLVNVGTSAQSNMTITVSNFTAAATAKVYQSVNGAAPTAAANATISNGSISGLSIAANTITLIVASH